MNIQERFRRWSGLSFGIVLVVFITACSPQTIEVEKEVIRKVEVPVEVVKEVEIEKEVTVEVVKEIEVTRLIESEVNDSESNNQESLISSVPVSYLFDEENPVGVSHLVRTEDGLQVGMTASGLIPGSALNLWLLVFNHPEKCVRGPFDCGLPDHGTNRAAQADFLLVPNSSVVVGESGTISLSGSINANDPKYSGWPEFPSKCPLDFPDCGDSTGLTNPNGALVRVMLHSHGPAADGELLEAQMNSYLGSCQQFVGSFEGNFSGSLDEIPSTEGECASILNATHHPDNAEEASSVVP